MNERVSTIQGKLPIIIVAPHGFEGDDENTSVIAEQIATAIGTYAVINRGWERDENVDFMLDKADCNNVLHCHEDVVRDEILDPILRYKNRILQNHHRAFVYYIHGMANKHRKYANDPDMDVVIGYGAGSPNSFTCELWQKDLFCHLLQNQGIHPYEGKAGGTMSGWARNNMNQLFRKWYPDSRVASMQIEIIHDLRNEKDMAMITAEYIASAIKDVSQAKSFSGSRNNKSY